MPSGILIRVSTIPTRRPFRSSALVRETAGMAVSSGCRSKDPGHEPNQARRTTTTDSPIMALRARCKMCAVIPHHLGKGGPLRASRCIPPGSWRIFGVEPCRASKPYRRFITRGEISVLPAEGLPSAPIDMKGVSPPPHGSHSPDLEHSRSTATGPWRNVRRSIALGRASELPETPWPTVRRLDAASVAPLNPAILINRRGIGYAGKIVDRRKLRL